VLESDTAEFPQSGQAADDFSHPQFTIVRKLAQGSLTEVFEGVAISAGLHGRRFALKVLRGRNFDESGKGEILEWFVRIGMAAARLRHPCIVACYDVAQMEHAAYITLDFVAGSSLHEQIVRPANWPVTDVMRIVREVASALDFAHGQGIVHGHLHPKHILLASEGQPRLIGFGEYPLPPGCPFGNPAHLAPEQILESLPTTPLSDVYALSESAFWMLTGMHPFYTSRGISELLAAKGKGQCKSLRERRPDLPGAVEDVLREGMATRPANRFPSAGAFADALAASVEAPRKARKWWRLWS